MLPEKPSGYGWGEGVAAGRQRSCSQRISADLHWAGPFLATFSLSSFEISQQPPAPTTCHVFKERCGWLPATTRAPNYVKSRVRFLLERETLKFSPQDLLANLC